MVAFEDVGEDSLVGPRKPNKRERGEVVGVPDSINRAWTAIIKAARDSRMTCTCAPLESATEFPGKHDRHVSVSGRRQMAKLAWQ